MITPRIVPVVSITGLLGLIVSGLLTFWVVQSKEDEQQHDCQRAVAVREDARAMWLYLVDTAHADPKRVSAFVKELNSRLPPLECHDGNALPAKP